MVTYVVIILASCFLGAHLADRKQLKEMKEIQKLHLKLISEKQHLKDVNKKRLVCIGRDILKHLPEGWVSLVPWCAGILSLQGPCEPINKYEYLSATIGLGRSYSQPFSYSIYRHIPGRYLFWDRGWTEDKMQRIRGGRFSSYEEMLKSLVKDVNDLSIEVYERNIYEVEKYTRKVNEFKRSINRT